MKETIIFIIIAVVVMLNAQTYAPQLESLLASMGTSDKPTVEVTSDNNQVTVKEINTTNNMETLKKEDLVVGTGAEAKNGDVISVHYVGTLLDGTKFDSSRDRGTPFEFTLGAGKVIQGWDQGVLGMKVGGKRKLTIPPSLGYGNFAQGKIPANSILVFEVELLGVKSK